MVPRHSEQSPQVLPLLFRTRDLECGHHHGVVVEGWTRRRVKAGNCNFHCLRYRERPAICSAATDGNALLASTSSTAHVWNGASANGSAELLPRIYQPRR